MAGSLFRNVMTKKTTLVSLNVIFLLTCGAAAAMSASERAALLGAEVAAGENSWEIFRQPKERFGIRSLFNYALTLAESTPISPPSGSPRWLFQAPPAESNFLAATPISPPSGSPRWLFQAPPAESNFLAARHHQGNQGSRQAAGRLRHRWKPGLRLPAGSIVHRRPHPDPDRHRPCHLAGNLYSAGQYRDPRGRSHRSR